MDDAAPGPIPARGFTSDQLLYLRPDTKLEPLVCGWYAWSHLIAPLPWAMNLAFRQLGLMASFSKNPSIHLSAAADPTLFGGPFIALPLAAAPSINELMERSSRLPGPGLARGLKALAERLSREADGSTLERFRSDIPSELAGVVELCYDCFGNASFRIIEELTYDSIIESGRWYDVGLTRTNDRDRDFFLSSPRIQSKDNLIVRCVDLSHTMSYLARLRDNPKPSAAIRDDLNLSEQQFLLMQGAFLTADAPPTETRRYSITQIQDAELKVTYFGHACVLMQGAGVSILTDPLLNWDERSIEAGLSHRDLPDRIDYVLISHAHHDHFSIETLLQLRHKVGCVIVPRNRGGSLSDPSLRRILSRLGFTEVLEMQPFDRVTEEWGSITSLPFPGEHGELDIDSKQSLLVEIAGKKLVFLVDSNCSEPRLFDRVAEKLGKVDAAFVGLECHGAPVSWLYGPLLTKGLTRRADESRRLSASTADMAMQVLERLGCESVFIYAMGQEPWLRFLMGRQYDADSIQLLECRKLLSLAAEKGMLAKHLETCGVVELARDA